MTSPRPPLTLVADIGNTQMVFGLFADNAGDAEGDALVAHWRLSSQRQQTADELAWQMHGLFARASRTPEEVGAIMAASVVPHLDGVFAGACQRVFGLAPAFVGAPEVKTGMAVDYKNPREVGADRIANAIAARAMVGAPVIVLDCGTATTFDIVSPAGHYAGGLILPGLEIGLEALSRRAARLPEVSLRARPELIARDTVASIQSGSYWGAVEAIAGIVRRLRAEPGYACAPLIATGGLAALLRDDLPQIDRFAPHLTLEGLRLLAERHFARGGAAHA